MFRSSYDHHQVYKSYHVHVLITHNKNMYMIALVDLMMVIHVVNIKTSCNLQNNRLIKSIVVFDGHNRC